MQGLELTCDPTPTRRQFRCSLVVAAFGFLAIQGVLAAPASRITQVMVYPGGASVERVAKVAAGSTSLVLECLGTGFDADSLQISADAGISVGDVTVRTMDRKNVPVCQAHPLDARLRELTNQRAALSAERESLDVALNYLRSYAQVDRGTGAPANLGATSDALRGAAQQRLLRQHALEQQREALDQEIAPLVAERDRQRQTQVRQITIRLTASRDGIVRVNYQVPQAAWNPSYRAHLETSTSKLRLERMARVAQSSGEDWVGVKLQLSTVQPQQASGLLPPSPWTLDLKPMAPERPAPPMYGEPPRPVPSQRVNADLRVAKGLPNFDVSVFEHGFDTVFDIPGEVDLASSDEASTFLLHRGEAVSVEQVSQVQPQREAAAYLIVTAPRPQGIWPAGMMQLMRDGRLVGQTTWRLDDAPTMFLAFGRDERVRVEVFPDNQGAGQTGLLGNRQQQRLQRRYLVENRDAKPLTIQVLEPSPVAQHDDIRVEASYKPEPLAEVWQNIPGVRVWQQRLAPGQRLDLEANYVISAPKDARLIQRR